MADKRIEILSDIEDVVTFETIVTDTIDRNDVKEAEERIAKLEAEVSERIAEIDLLKEKLAHAKEIIALADEKKLVEQQEVEY